MITPSDLDILDVFAKQLSPAGGLPVGDLINQLCRGNRLLKAWLDELAQSASDVLLIPNPIAAGNALWSQLTIKHFGRLRCGSLSEAFVKNR